MFQGGRKTSWSLKAKLSTSRMTSTPSCTTGGEVSQKCYSLETGWGFSKKHCVRSFFSANGLPTIVSNTEVKDMGQRVKMTQQDIDRVSHLYNCSKYSWKSSRPAWRQMSLLCPRHHQTAQTRSRRTASICPLPPNQRTIQWRLCPWQTSCSSWLWPQEAAKTPTENKTEGFRNKTKFNLFACVSFLWNNTWKNII